MHDRKIGRIKFLGYFPVACKLVWSEGDRAAPLKIITRAAENNYAAVADFLPDFRMRQ